MVNYENPFDATPGTLFGFVTDVEYHAQKFGWTTEDSGIFWIPDDIANAAEDDATFKNLLTNYGEISLDHLCEWEGTYLDTESREAQDSVQAFHSLRASLTPSALAKVNVHKAEYTIGGIPSGPLFYKVIMRESHLDTNATALSIREQLGSGSMASYLQSVSYDITKFNQHILVLIESLKARGETTNDLLANLFTAYASVKDEEFRPYVSSKRSDYEDRTRQFDYPQLMVLFENKFKNLVLTERWSHESYEDRFMALQDKQEKTNRDMEKLHRQKKKNNPTGTKNDAKGRKGKKKGKDNLPGWMTVEPKPDKLRELREYNGKPWYWCSAKTGGKCNPGAYRRHKPADCRGNASKSNKRKSQNDNEEKSSAAKHKLKVSQAILGIESEELDSE